jgi:uncharacterized protein YjbK
MEKNIEIEYKTFVSGEAASALLAQGVFRNGQLQTNYYYDTEDHYFTSNRGVLRIREKNDTFRFTAKLKKEGFIEEYECDCETLNIENPDILEFTQKYTSSKIFNFLGKTTTYRYTYQDEFGVWCLDFNVLKYNSDIEMEYELHEDILEADEHFNKQLQLWGIKYLPSESKFQRLMKDKDSTD